MKVLFIGLGSIGQRHLRNLLQLGTFEIYAYRVRSNPLPDEFEYINVNQVYDLGQLSMVKPDLCIIASPPTVQERVLPFVINAGCNFFIEKPIATMLDGLNNLLEKVEKQKLTTMVGYNLRYHPVYKKLTELLAGKIIGNIVSVRASVGQYLPDWHPSEDYRLGYSANQSLGGGVILDLIHEIDFVYSLFGEVVEVKAMISTKSSLEIDTENTSEILIKFRNGILGQIHLDYVQRKPMRNGIIIGDRGTVLYDLLENEVIVTNQDGVKEKYRYDFQRNDMYIKELKDFIQAIRTKTELPNNFKAGINVLKIALQAKSDASIK